ncbi:hypothetical protein CN140_01600 [Sinorhizobium meliloti]|uniref:hypothetical protein n=1 Tax=Rhizobium meliloti TaxID=382 RepID=UPI000FDA45D3|nr:hypothetical protein [Sinorhizobium meliloti]RVL87653.1 hypothetical protein CN140_01600 [Sinorhizobium meliloti]
MKEVVDHEIRALIIMERIVKWGRDGGVERSKEIQRARIADARGVIRRAQSKLLQIEVMQVSARKLSFAEQRDQHMAKIADQHRAAAAEKKAIQAAVDEFLALESIIPADDIEDILSEVSAALGVDLPNEADKADICQRTHKSMEDLKRFLGPSLAAPYIHPVQAVQAAVDEHQQAEELIADVRRTALLQGMVDDTSSDDYIAAGALRQAAEDKLTIFVRDLINRAHIVGYSPEWVEPPRGYVDPIQEVVLTSGDDVQKDDTGSTGYRFTGAWFRPDGSAEWIPFGNNSKIDPIQEVNATVAAIRAGSPHQREAVIQVGEEPAVPFHEWAQKTYDETMALVDKGEPEALDTRLYDVTEKPSVMTRQWLMDNIVVFDAATLDWIDKHYPEDDLDDETLESARQAVCAPFDAGKTLRDLGWSPPSGEPHDQPYGITSRDEAIRRMAS